MTRKGGGDNDLTALDELIETITTDAYGDDEQLWAFRQAFEEEVRLPADGFVIGEPVSVHAIDYNGNERRGLTATCRREGGAEYVVAASEVAFPVTLPGARLIAAYRRWLNLEPYPGEAKGSSRRKRKQGVTPDALDLSKPVELVALSVAERTARCSLLRSDRTFTLRASRLWDVVPGEIVTVTPRKQWRYGGHPYLSGEIESTRLEVAALGLVPLGLEPMGVWDPETHYRGEPEEPIAAWTRPIIRRGLRPAFEMVSVLPGADIDDPFDDPISQASALKDAGESAAAGKILMELCQADLRCLDAHAHLGNLVFDCSPAEAIRHYAVGVRIGELSLGVDFAGVLPWGHIGNRPFLRCLHGYGLCLWRLGRVEEAERVFERMLWLNPSDNQGVRVLIEAVSAGIAWQACENE